MLMNESQFLQQQDPVFPFQDQYVVSHTPTQGDL